MTTTDVNDFLLAGGIPAAKFEKIGDLIKGTIVSAETSQQTEFGTGALKFFDDGKPMMQAVVTLQTDQRDPQIDDDQGLRKLYVRGQMTAAVRDALRKANAKLEVGGTLAVQYKEDEPAKQRGFNPKKVYVAQYKPGAPSTDAANDLLDGDSSAPADAGVPAEDLI